MNKIKCVLLVICVVFLCCGCGLFTEEYTCNMDEVKSVYIVHLDQYVEGEYRFDYTVLCEVADTAGFIGRLNTIDQEINWGDPRKMQVGYTAIRIDYKNGDYDMVHQDVAILHRSGKNRNGYVFFDDDQFKALISDYISE